MAVLPLVAVLALAAGRPAHAQAQAPVAAPAPSLEAEGLAFRLASLLRNAPEVAQALADLGGREADERAARWARFPRLELQGEYGSLSADVPRTGRSSVDSRVVAGTRLTLFDFGRASARIEAAARGVSAGEQLVRRATETVALDAVTTYLQVLRFALLREVGRDSERALRGIEQLESRRVELGGAGVTDARLASSRLALSANRLVQFEASLEEARARFAVLFGFSPMPDQLPPLRVPAAWVDENGERVLASARGTSPELLAASHRVEQSRQQLEVERASRWPAVDLTWSRRYEFPNDSTSSSPQVGVMLSTNSLGVFEAQARVVRAAARVTQDEEQLRLLERDLAQAVQTALQRHALGREREALLRNAAAESAAVFEGRQRLNAAGRETTLALLDAQVEANNILIDWVHALFDQRIAELRLAKEAGRLVPNPGEDVEWARALFAADDFRGPVRDHLAGAGRRNAATVPARAVGLGALGAAWSGRIGLVRTRQ